MFDAIVLAGGTARRLGGADKPGLEIGGVTLLDHVLAAAAGAERVVVAGPPRPTSREVVWVREDPPGAGPVAALAAALPRTRAARVLVLAADLPAIAPAVALLLAAVPDGGVALLEDARGRVNHLAAAWDRAALAAALARVGDPAGAAMRALGAPTTRVRDRHGWGADCDTWADLRAARTAAHLYRPDGRYEPPDSDHSDGKGEGGTGPGTTRSSPA